MSKYLRPNIQLFAAPAADDDDPAKKGGSSSAQNGDSAAGDGNSAAADESLPKTQEELDALINSRLKREQKKWSKQQAAPPAAVPAVPDPAAPAASATQPQAPSAVDNTELQNAQKELVAARAQLAAIKSGIAPAAVEDAVLLAMHEVEKNGDDPDEDSVSEALKVILKRHPEWKKEEDPKKQGNAGFRVGAGTTETSAQEDDKLSSIFGNLKK
ncbi:hypothetical protein [Faecalispora anaeroviscerum]|uniref:hypothetical protein n=1 Tax=Faecalispora anaeroviscerum TaxID=2991836 RepID=UPI0024BB9B6E|nr:hypothetical protein [Faecalispora anaeroviscerum]